MILPLLNTQDGDFADAFRALVARLRIEEGLRVPGEDSFATPQETVRLIIEDVRMRGDAALLDYTARFDGCSLTPAQLTVSSEEIDAAVGRCSEEFLRALGKAAERIRRFQEATLVAPPADVIDGGRRLGVRYTPLDSAAIYVPGGSAPLASSVLMAAVPARVAGVARVAMATPPRSDGTISDDRLAAASIAGIEEVYRIGGAQAIAALAYGTDSVRAVDFIAGPGNLYTTLAKKEVFGTVGIETLPGPSEVVIIADAAAEARHVAADLLAQAEHAPGSAMLLTDDAPFAQAVLGAIEEQLAELTRAAAARAGLRHYGAAIVCASLDECVELTNRLAPEHVQVMTENAEDVAARVRHAGAIFLGPWTPVAVGDYIAGPSHVLPTSTTARFSSGLSANDFRKRTSIICYDRAALAEDAADVTRLAEAEGLDAHRASIRRRLDKMD